jgi:capsular exopolysaccharide synthesis family protein
MSESNMREPQSLQIGEIWNLLVRQRLAIALCTLLGVGAGVALGWTKEQTYSGSVVIRVDDRRQGLPSLDARVAVPTGNQVAAEIAVLRSRALAAFVVDSLGLQVRVAPAELRAVVLAGAAVDRDAPGALYRVELEGGSLRVRTEAGEVVGSTERDPDGEADGASPNATVFLPGAALHLTDDAFVHAPFAVQVLPRDEAVLRLADRLRIHQPNRDAGIIRVEYRSRDPRLGRDVPNVLAAHFIALRQETHQSESRSAIAFLRSQLATIATQLAETEEALQAYREETGVVDIDAERGSRIRLLMGLKAERDALEAERAALAGLVREVDTQALRADPLGPSPYRRLVAFPALLRNETASDLVRSLTRVEDERAALANRRRPDDPEMVGLANRIRELEAWLRSVVDTYLEGLTRQVSAMDGQLIAYQDDLARIPQREMLYGRLARAAVHQEEIHSQLQRRLKEAEIVHAIDDPSVRVVDEAHPVADPLLRQRVLVAGVLAILGMVMGVGVGVFREVRDTTVRSRRDLQTATGLPVLGLIPRAAAQPKAVRVRVDRDGGRALGAPRQRTLEPGRRPPAPAGLVRAGVDAGVRVIRLAPGPGSAPPRLNDPYHRMSFNLRWMEADHPLRALLFTSPLPGDGKTTVVVNYATALASAGQRVLVIDADLHHVSLSREFGVEEEPGLADLLRTPGAHPSDVLLRVGVADGVVVDCIAAGLERTNALHLLRSPRLSELVKWGRPRYDALLFDSPPSTLVSDAFVISENVDGVVLVTRAAVTPIEAVALAADEFRGARAPVLGTVLNDIRMKRDTTYDRAYRYYAAGNVYEYSG